MIHITENQNPALMRERLNHWKRMRGELPPLWHLPALPARTASRSRAPEQQKLRYCAYPPCGKPFLVSGRSRALHCCRAHGQKHWILNRKTRRAQRNAEGVHYA